MASPWCLVVKKINLQNPRGRLQSNLIRSRSPPWIIGLNALPEVHEFDGGKDPIQDMTIISSDPCSPPIPTLLAWKLDSD